MPIERSLTTDQYQALPEADKGLYEATDSGYQFAAENVGALKRAKDHEVAKRRDVTQQLEALKKQLAAIESDKAAAEHDKAVETKNSEALNKSWQDKYDKALAKEKSRADLLQESIRRTHLTGVIDKFVDDITVPKFAHLVRPMVEKRIDVKIGDDGIPKTFIRDVNGQESADTLKDLTKELRADKRNEDVLKEQAKGSGTTEQPRPADLQVGDRKVETSSVEAMGYQSKLSPDDLIVDEFRRVAKTNPQRVTEFSRYLPKALPSDF